MSVEKSIRIVTFSGKRNDWRQWSKKFLAVAERKEYRLILEKDSDMIEKTAEEKKKMNSLAYNDLLLSMTDDVSFGLVDESSSVVYPEGDAHMAWGKLMQRYESQTNASRVKLMGQFSSSRLKKNNQDPDSWISELELMRIRLKKMGTPIDDEYLMMHILNNLPSAYDSLIENLEDRLDSVLDPLTLSILRDKLSEKYEKIRKRKGWDDDSASEDEEERALFAKSFKGRCRKCGKFGHKGADCRSNGKQNQGNQDKTKTGKGRAGGGKFQGKCYHCGKIGHREADCWKKHGKPKANEEQGNQAAEEPNEDEVALAGLSDDDYVYVAMSDGDTEDEGVKRRRTVDQDEDNESEMSVSEYDDEDDDSEGTYPRNDCFEVAMLRRTMREASLEETKEAEMNELDQEDQTEEDRDHEPNERVADDNQWSRPVDPNDPGGWRAAYEGRPVNPGWYQNHEQQDPTPNNEQDVKKDNDGAMAGMECEMALGSPTETDGMDDELWLGDTGASCHMTNNLKGMSNLEKISTGIVFGNGQRLKAVYVGDKRGTVVQKDGTKKSILMKNVKYVPEMYCNLFSISAALKEGCTLEGSKNNLKINSSNQSYVFDQQIKSGKGFLFGIKITHKGTAVEKPRQSQAKAIKQTDFIKIHQQLGHPGEDMTRATGLKLGLRMKGSMHHCEGCGLGKMKQKNINKELVARAKSVGERMFMDISSIKHKSAGGAKFWALFMDDYSGFLMSRFLKKKSDLAEEGSTLIKRLNIENGIKVKAVRCDNAGENKKMEEKCVAENLGVKFEYTAVGTPQQNGRVERKFATLFGRIRSMMIDAGLNEELRHKLWAEAANMSADLDNILVKNKNDKNAYQMFYNMTENPKYVKNLKRFGEVGFILKRQKIKSKVSNRGKKGIMIGYVKQSGGDTYRMFNLETNMVTNTRDIKWTNKLYGEYHKLNESQEDYHTASECDEAKVKAESSDDENNDEDQKGEEPRRSERLKLEADIDKKVMSALKKLNVSYNPTMSAMVYEDDLAMVGGTDDLYDNPETFQEAWHHPDPVERGK